jgi:hypothetical protein
MGFWAIMPAFPVPTPASGPRKPLPRGLAILTTAEDPLPHRFGSCLDMASEVSANAHEQP